MTFAIIPQNLSIVAMRNSGYRDAAHAVAELVDNSIQAGERDPGTTEVELICLDAPATEGGRRSIERIAVYDNASGMDAETLRSALQFGNGTHLTPENQTGIGKFGMGLPNSSISQCKRVDVWTWRRGRVVHSYLDVSAIESGKMSEVPEPQLGVVPQEWLALIGSEIGQSGTLVVWSTLDRIKWKQSTAFLKNAEFLIGRIYRHFIEDGRARIRLAAYEQTGSQAVSLLERYVKPNDPLYLMHGTSAPAPYGGKPAFELFEEPLTLKVTVDGRQHEVTIKASICTKETRLSGGGSTIGRHAARNQGVSVVRAGREIELSKAFELSYDPRERWWGVEVAFEPGLDDVFGVSNNKQGAAGFQKLDEDADAEAEGMEVNAYRAMLKEDQDPRVPMYLIGNRIEGLLKRMRSRIVRMREAVKQEKLVGPAATETEQVATGAVRRRRKLLGDTGTSDKDERRPSDQRSKALSSLIEHEGIAADRAREIAVEYVERNIKFRFRSGDVPSSALFDVSPSGGVIVVTLNTRHAGHGPLFDSTEAGSEGAEALRRRLLFLVASWARMEDEASPVVRRQLEDARHEWGKIARDFFEDADD